MYDAVTNAYNICRLLKWIICIVAAFKCQSAQGQMYFRNCINDMTFHSSIRPIGLKLSWYRDTFYRNKSYFFHITGETFDNNGNMQSLCRLEMRRNNPWVITSGFLKWKNLLKYIKKFRYKHTCEKLIKVYSALRYNPNFLNTTRRLIASTDIYDCVHMISLVTLWLAQWLLWYAPAQPPPTNPELD